MTNTQTTAFATTTNETLFCQTPIAIGSKGQMHGISTETIIGEITAINTATNQFIFTAFGTRETFNRTIQTR